MIEILKRLMILSLVFLFFFPCSFVYADEALITEEKIEELETGDNKPTYAEKVFASILLAIPKTIINVLGAKDVSYLVFQDPSLSANLGKEDLEEGSPDYVLGIFPEAFFDGIAIFYDGIERMLPVPIVMLMTFAGLLLLLSNFGSDSQTRTNFKQYLAGLIFLVLFLRFGHFLWRIITNANMYITSFVWVTLKENGIPVGGFLETIWGETNTILTVQSLGLAALVLVATIMTFILNYQYTMRMINIGVLIMVFPLILIGLIFPSRREALNIWAYEFSSNVFLQSGHAFLIGFLFALRHWLGNDGITFWVFLAFMLGMPAVASIVQKMASSFFSVSTGGGGAMGNMGQALGFSTMLALSKMASKRKTNLPNTSPKKYSNEKSTDFGDNQQSKSSSLQQSNNSKSGGRIPVSDGRSQLGITSARPGMLKDIARLGGAASMKAAKGAGKFGLKATGAMVGAGISGMATGNIAGGASVGFLGTSALMDKGGQMFDAWKEYEGDSRENAEIQRSSSSQEQLNHQSILPPHLQTFAVKDNQSGNETKENLQAVDQQRKGTVSNTQFRSGEAIWKKNQSLAQQTDDRLKEMKEQGSRSLKPLDSSNQTNTVPTQKAIEHQQKIAQQAKRTSQQSSVLVNPQQFMYSPSSAAMQVANATENYQEAYQALESVDRNQYPEQYEQQKEVVQQARVVMNEVASYAEEQYPQLFSEDYQPIVTEYISAEREFAKSETQLEEHQSVSEPLNESKLKEMHQKKNQEIINRRDTAEKKLNDKFNVDQTMQNLRTDIRYRGGL